MSTTIRETPMILCDLCNKAFDFLFEADIYAVNGVPQLSWHNITDYDHDCVAAPLNTTDITKGA